jgi:hypothetical protein
MVESFLVEFENLVTLPTISRTLRLKNLGKSHGEEQVNNFGDLRDAY